MKNQKLPINNYIQTFKATASIGLVWVVLTNAVEVNAAQLKLPWRDTSGEWTVTTAPARNPASYHDNALDFLPPDLSKSWEILAPASGTIKDVCYGSQQNYVDVETQAGTFRLLHLDKEGFKVNIGQSVTQGDVLGKLYVGSVYDKCGDSTATHLHLKFPKFPITLDGYTFDGTGYLGGNKYKSTNSPFDYEAARKNIRKAYQDILQREPDKQLLEKRIDELKSGKNITQLRETLANTQEAKDKLKKTARDLLSRDLQDLTEWVNKLVQGGSQKGIREEIAETHKQEIEKKINETVRDLLGRDSQNLTGWVNKLVQGGSQKGIREEIAETHKEEIKKNINQTIKDILERDSQALDDWFQKLKAGDVKNLQALRVEIANSQHARDKINEVYQKELGRNATESEIKQIIDSIEVHANMNDVRWAVEKGVILFPDVPRNHPFADNIYELVYRGVVSGSADGLFHPENFANRGETSKFTQKGFELNADTNPGEVVFPDVLPDHAFYDEISILHALDVIGGYPDGRFRPEESVRRDAVSKFVFNSALARHGDISFNTSCGDFPDVSVDNNFYNYVTTLKCDGIIGGYPDGNFQPQEKVDRGALSKFIDNAFTFYNDYAIAKERLNGIGIDQNNPVLPDQVDGEWKLFSNILSGLWYDPPALNGLEYQAIGDSLFTSILDFPVGLDSNNLFTVSVGNNILGEFSPGEKVDFVSLLGSGVSNFKVTGIEPSNGTDPIDFPLQLEFSNRLNSFKMRSLHSPQSAKPVPEPTSLLGLLAFIGGISLLKSKKSSSNGNVQE